MDPAQSSEALENLYNILVASKMSLFKCRDLLEINKGSEQKGSSSLTQFRLQKTTEEITNIIELQSRGKKIKINVNYTEQSLINAKFLNDQTKYQQVLLNVLSNAVMYSPTGGNVEVALSSTTLIQQEKDSNGAAIERCLLSVIVHDMGPGISLEDQ